MAFLRFDPDLAAPGDEPAVRLATPAPCLHLVGSARCRRPRPGARRGLVGRLRAWRRHRREWRELAALDAHLLADIGLTAADVERHRPSPWPPLLPPRRPAAPVLPFPARAPARPLR